MTRIGSDAGEPRVATGLPTSAKQLIGQVSEVGPNSSKTPDFSETAMIKRWRCIVCGYIHDGEKPPLRCPVCGAPADMFEDITPAPDG